MRAYGIPRDSSYACPDKGDIRAFGLPGCAGSFPGKNVEYRSHFKNAAAKAAVRRIWKRRAGAEGKVAARAARAAGRTMGRALLAAAKAKFRTSRKTRAKPSRPP